ncbi:MAG TPA: lipase maturation factor family protein [Candidatus Acidoferrum sp.]|nr:lipase maturation factor family protein [Candidatus Acidoferrum sp.]
MDWTPASVVRWLFDSKSGLFDRFLARWIFLRALGLIYFSAFFSLVFQIRGLIGPSGILPAGEYLQALVENYGRAAYWYGPSLLWFSSGSHALMLLCWAGMIASLLLACNLWPRAMLFVCFLSFLSFVAAAGEFSGYQSDGMLLEAGFLSLFVAPAGLRPRLGEKSPPVRVAYFLLLWEWFRIYFESGVAKIASGDPEWRHFTAMDEYYQNGPLPTWIGWYAQQRLPHGFHVGSAFLTIALELVLIWAAFLPRRVRIALFFLVTPWQIGIILTANYTFLNYIVLFLAFLLLDDRFYSRFFPLKWTKSLLSRASAAPADSSAATYADQLSILSPAANPASSADTRAGRDLPPPDWKRTLRRVFAQLRVAAFAIILTWIFYAATAQMLLMIAPDLPLPLTPIALLDPSRIANRYGLFAVMTRGRYEIEFQGSNDGQTWIPYPFRFKPQDVNKAPGIYAPYQPRFDWNLWFASLGEWRGNPLVLRTERRLLSNDKDVLALFAANPFPKNPPRQVRAVLWQYWFTTPEEKKATGAWWRRQLLGLYAPAIELEPDGRIGATELPQPLPPHE